MQIVIHLGAHCTDEDALLKSLISNQKTLYHAGIAVPGPGRYRPMIREALAQLKGAPASGETSQAMLGHILGQAKPHTLVLGSDTLICAPRFVLGQRRIYPMVGDRLKALRGLFPEHPMSFSFAIRNPATFIPALHHRMEAEIGFDRMIAAIELQELRWSETILTMRRAVPDARITVWCNEDSPLLWPDIMRRVTQHPADLHLTDTERVVAPLLREGGVERLQSYLAERPGLTTEARRKILTVFLEKFGDPDALEEEFDLPGWSEATIWELTRAYEMDMDRIAEIPDVDLLRL